MYAILDAKTNFKFLTPFESLNLDREYTIVGVNKLSNYTATSIDLLATVYEPYGLTQLDIDADTLAGHSLVTLVNDSEEIYIPSNYLEVHDSDRTTHRYTRRVLILDVGGLPIEEDLALLKDELVTSTTNLLGVTPHIREVVTTPITFVLDSTHDLAKANRIIKRTSNNNSKVKVFELERQIDNLIAEINSLRCIINTLDMP